MTTWYYIGCETKNLPENIDKDSKTLTNNEIKEILKTIPIVEGKIEAYNIDTVVALLLHDNIFPLKIRPVVSRKDLALEKFKKIKKSIN